MIGITPFNTLPFNTVPEPATEPRGLSSGIVGGRYARGLRTGATARHGAEAAGREAIRAAPAFDRATRVTESTRIVCGRGKGVVGVTTPTHGQGIRLDFAAWVVWSQGIRRVRGVDATLAAGIRRGNQAVAVWDSGFRFRAGTIAGWIDGVPLQTPLLIRYHPNIRLQTHRDIVWRAGRHPVYVTPVPTPPVIPTPGPGSYQGLTHLVFGEQAMGFTHLVFRPRKRAKVLAQKEFYTVLNTAYVKRVDDDTPIACKALRIAGDRESWSLRFSGEAFWSERSKLAIEGGPVEIEIGVNGLVWRALVKTVRPNRTFGGETLSFEGVSKSAVLAAPYAPQRTRTNAEPAYAQQIALAELEFTGWTLDWDIVDWLLPAGAYSLAQTTPVDAVKRIVESAGGFLQTARTDAILRALPRYAVMPWHWGDATPDVILPADAFEAMPSNWNEKPAYNGVYVSGQNHGVNALVKRDGTDGATLAPMVVDALLTHSDANRARGAAILADTGNQEDYAVTLGVYPETGVIDPGNLVQVTEGASSWKALAKGFDLDVQWRDPDGLTVLQTVVLERHYG